MHQFLLIMHFLGLAMGLGTSFAMMTLGIIGSKMDVSERTDFMIKVLGIGKYGRLGIYLLLISGLGMVHPYINSLMQMPLFLTKIGLFIILFIILMIIKKNAQQAIQEKGGPSLLAIKKLGQFALPMGIIIVILAVIQFS